MPVITENLADMAGVADPRAVVTFTILKPRASADGSKLIVVRDVSYTPDAAGHLVTDNLEPGPAIVRLGGIPYDVIIPTGATTIRAMLAVADLVPPPDGVDFVASVAGLNGIVGASDLAAALQPYLANPTWSSISEKPAVVGAGATEAAARAVLGIPGTYAALPGNRTVVWGNSVDIGAEVSSPLLSKNSSWFNYLSILSGQRIEHAKNAGVAGDTTTQMLDRFAADVAPHNPRIVILGGGENDADPSRNVSLATYKANIITMIGLARSIGAAVVLRTTLPNNATGQRRTNINAQNMWIRRMASTLGAIAVLDFHNQLVDPTTGGIQAAYNSDGTHPNDLGYGLLGQYAAERLVPLVPAAGNLLTHTNTDGGNLLSNGLFLGPLIGASLDQSPSWYYNASAGASVTLTPGVRGNQFTITLNNSQNEVFILQQLGGQQALVGHKLLYVARIVSQLTAGMIGDQSVSTDVNLNLARAAYNMAGPISGGILQVPLTVAAGATLVNILHRIPAGATGTVAISQASLYDLTALGVAA